MYKKIFWAKSRAKWSITGSISVIATKKASSILETSCLKGETKKRPKRGSSTFFDPTRHLSKRLLKSFCGNSSWRYVKNCVTCVLWFCSEISSECYSDICLKSSSAINSKIPEWIRSVNFPKQFLRDFRLRYLEEFKQIFF